MDFKPITLEHRSWLERIRSYQNDSSTAYSFPSLFTWQPALGLTVAGDDRFFVVRSNVTGDYFQPCGEPEAIHDFILSLMKAGQPFRMVHITETLAQWFEKQGYPTTENRDDEEYLYDWHTFAHPTRTCGHAIKIKVIAFSKCYDYTASLITSDDSKALQDILLLWSTTREELADEVAATTAISHIQDLGLQGILLKTSAGNAFCLGYPNTKDEFTIAFVKATPAISQDASIVCFHELAKALEGRWSTINLEEDCGLPGLRNMKMHLHPTRLLKLYSLTFPATVS